MFFDENTAAHFQYKHVAILDARHEWNDSAHLMPHEKKW
jgi:hypothetical protein